MSRLRARSANNTHWIDICQSSWKVLSADGTRWIPFTPSQNLNVRHGAEKYWLRIDCMKDETAICDEDQYGGTSDGKGANGTGPGNLPGGTGTGGGGIGGGSGGGGIGGIGGGGSGGGGIGGIGGGDGIYGGGNGPGSIGFNDPDAGSGNGSGGNSGFGGSGPYPPGYDLPDSDGDGAGLQGSCIMRPGLGTCEELHKDQGGGTCKDGRNRGHYECPFDCGDVAMDTGTGIWEYYVKPSGTNSMTLDWLASVGGMSIDAYVKGKRVGTTDGLRVGSDKLTFIVDPEEMVFIRVRTRVRVRWIVQITCFELDDSRGTLSNPHNCKGNFKPFKAVTKQTYYHKMGNVPGRVDISYDMYDGPDMLVVHTLDGEVLATTGVAVTHVGTMKFDYVPDETQLIAVTVTSSTPGNWEYTMHCPGELGGKANPRPCNDTSAVTSGGAGVTDTYVSLGSVAGKMGIRYQMWYVPDKMDVYQNGSLVATTGEPVTGDHWLYFDYDPSKGTDILIRITGVGETTWAFLHDCPGQDTINITANDTDAKEGSETEPGKLCWNVTLDKPSSTPVKVDYTTGGGTAQPLTAQGRILASDTAGRPFVACVDQKGVGRAIFDGGFPKFYNENFTPPMLPPKGDAVFNTWPRTSGGAYYANLAAVPPGNEATKWVLNSSGDIQCTINASSVLTFVSPSAYDDYTFSAYLKSTDSDDDTIGLVVASTAVGSTLFQILAIRHRGGMRGYGKTFSLVFMTNGSVTRILADKEIGGTGGWSGRFSRVEVQKECGIIRAYCGDWNADELDPNSELTYDLTTDTQLNTLFATSQFGFMTQSQDASTFYNIFLSGIGLNSDFTYLKNSILWTSRTSNPTKKLLAVTDTSAATLHYAMNEHKYGFAIAMRGMGDACGMVTTTGSIQDKGALTLAELSEYDCMVVIGSHVAPNILTPASLAAISQYVKNGGGLVVITDHDVFQNTVNQIAGMFNIQFYGDMNRTPVQVADILNQHGEHPVWDGLACKTIWAGGSEGAIKLIERRSDYYPAAGTLTFAPGEVSKEVCIDLIGNDVVDGDRTVHLELSNPDGGEIVKPSGVGTIKDDDSKLCKQHPTAPVNGAPGGPHGAELMYVQPNMNCAAGNTWYLMKTQIDFPVNGAYNFLIHSDDNYELYIDCKLVAQGPIGVHAVTLTVAKGKRDIVLRYLNVPNCTPGYATFSIVSYGSLMYVCKAADWKGQANHVGEI